MKKIVASVLLAFAVLAGGAKAWAAAASVISTEYGYTITGGTSTTLVPQDTWVTSTAYAVGQFVSQTGHVYKCIVAHTSGTFATDLSNGKWVKIAEATIYLYSAQFVPSGATDTAIFTSLAATDNTAQMAAFTMNLNQEQLSFVHPQTFGTPFRNLKVTLSNAANVVNLYVYKDNFTRNDS